MREGLEKNFVLKNGKGGERMGRWSRDVGTGNGLVGEDWGSFKWKLKNFVTQLKG